MALLMLPYIINFNAASKTKHHLSSNPMSGILSFACIFAAGHKAAEHETGTAWHACHQLSHRQAVQLTAALPAVTVQVQQEMSLVKSQALTPPLKSSLEAVGAQVKLEAAGVGVITPGAALPGCSVRSLLQDMGLQVIFHPLVL